VAGGSVLGREIREDRLSPGYVFYGEETYRAEKFVSRLRSVLLSSDAQAFNLEKFDLETTGWAEILDVARTVPFFFAPWRIVYVTAREDSRAKLSASDENLIRQYCQSPAEKTILVVVIPGKGKKTHPLVRLFGSLPAGVEVHPELKPVKRGELQGWISRAVGGSAKVITPEATEKLADIVGSDLRRIDQELDKLLTYVSDRRVIDIQDVLDVCDWGRTFAEWELLSALEKADYRQALIILAQRFQEGIQPQYILGTVAGFFRDLLLAKLLLRENRDRKEIFAFFRPRVQSNWSNYPALFREFFSLVESLTDAELNLMIGRLRKVDMLIKSSDVPAQAMLEGFIFDFCRLRRRPRGKKRPTSRERV
jgi:DNA polymerase III delta subunit